MSDPKQTRIRRTHGKSRNGCLECKRRRIKCNEDKGGCSYCARREIVCVYPSHLSETRASTTPSASGSQQSTCTPPGPASSGISPGHSNTSIQAWLRLSFPSTLNDDAELNCFTMNDLILLHHWSVVTSLTMVNTPGVNHIWQTVMVQVASQNPYVMQGILSLTALHLAYLDPPNKHTLIATAAQYHNRHLRDFQAKICNIDQHDSDALFASASINLFYVIAAFGDLYHGYANESSAIRRARVLGEDWIALIRGVNRLIEQIRERVRVGPLGSLLYLGNWLELDPDTTTVPHDAEIQSLRSIWAGSIDAAVYDESLYLLRKCWAWTTQFSNFPDNVLPQLDLDPDWAYNRSWSGPFIWLSLAPDAYFLRLQQRQPAALLLFAHFGGLSAGLEGYWWMEGWGKNIVLAAADTLGSYWNDWMELPRRLAAGTWDENPPSLGDPSTVIMH